MRDNRRFEVDAFARWRIVDAVQFRRAVGGGGIRSASGRLETILNSELREVLNSHSAMVIDLINSTLVSLPQKTEEIELVISPDQDGEGTFSVNISLSGPDLYVLNKSIEKTAELFNVRHTPDGLEPPVPLMDPFEEEFEVNDTLCHTVFEWLEELWIRVKKENVNLPVTVTAEEYYGTMLPKNHTFASGRSLSMGDVKGYN